MMVWYANTTNNTLFLLTDSAIEIAAKSAYGDNIVHLLCRWHIDQ